MTDPKILSSMELPFPVRDECGEAVVEQGKEERISVTYVGQGIEAYVEAPTQEKGRNVPESFSFKNDQEQNDNCTPHEKGMHGPSNEGIPDSVPERVVHPL
jgi:hypothetical protein